MSASVVARRRRDGTKPHDRADPQTDDLEPRAPRVLLAEDDPAFRSLLASVLREAGYEVHEAANGLELLNQVAIGLMRGEQHRAFDVVVADIRLPGHSGMEILNGMRSANLGIPVILITAFGDAETHRVAYELDARVLDKPFDMTELELAVAAAVSRGGGPPALGSPRRT